MTPFASQFPVSRLPLASLGHPLTLQSHLSTCRTICICDTRSLSLPRLWLPHEPILQLLPSHALN